MISPGQRIEPDTFWNATDELWACDVCVTTSGPHVVVKQAINNYRAGGHDLPALVTKAGNMRVGPVNSAAARGLRFVQRETDASRVWPLSKSISTAQSRIGFAVRRYGEATVANALVEILLEEDNDDTKRPLE